MKNLLIILAAFLLFSCKSKKKAEKSAQVVAESKPAPSWVSSRPNNAFKYVGIGFADKSKSATYAIEAKKNALYDLSSEIKVDISSNSVLYTVQNNKAFNESFNSMIKMSNTENIEGYQQVDTYENDKQYWVYYTLDKAEHARLKEQKKKQIITKASNLIASSFVDEQNQDFSSSLKKRIQAFGVLTPYLSEEINFVPAQTKGLKNVFDLTNLIQQQLQSITILQSMKFAQLKPYQQVYTPISYSLQVKGKAALQNFPFSITSEEDNVKIVENASTNNLGELQLKVTSVEPLNQLVGFSLQPDIKGLIGSDSIGRAGINVLRQFVQTSSLKVQAQVSPVNIYVSSSEKNYGKPTGNSIVSTFIQQRFNGQEVMITDRPENADYIIEANADTKDDVSSDVLEANYNLKLATLIVDLTLKNKQGESLFKTQVNEVYGYANSAEKAGINAYSSNKLNGKLGEALFFMKRKFLVY